MTNDELPQGWIDLGFDELNSFKSKTIDPSDYPDEVFELYSVPAFPTRKPELLAGRVIGSTKQVVEPGDVLICKINPRINRVWKVMPKADKRQIASSEWIVMRAKGMNSEFLRTYFCSQAFREILCEDLTGVGGSLTRAQPKRVAKFRVPLAPLAEQKRIADKLEAVLGRVDACRARLDRVPDLLKRFRQSVLAAATSGQLTEDWREETQDIASAKEATIGDICDITSGFGFPKHLQGKEDGKYPFAKVSDISRAVSSASGKLGSAANYVDESDLKELKAKPVPKGSTVFAKIGEAVRLNRRALGTCSLVIDNNCMALTPDTKRVLPEFVFLFMQTVDLSPFAVATTVPSVRRGDVESIGLTLFSLPEQAEIVRRVEALFALADRIEARLATAQRQVERLTPATLSKAFRGDLVPQDPNDEPATVLLDRLRQNEATTKETRRRQKS